MKLIFSPLRLSVCKLKDFGSLSLDNSFFFLAKTENELSLVCESDYVPENALKVENSWRCFYIDGTLDFSLVGILSKISTALADASIGLFAVSTYDTDYVLVKEESFDIAAEILKSKGYEVVFTA